MTPGQLVTYKGRKWAVVAQQGKTQTLIEQKPFWPFPGATLVVHSRELTVNPNTLEDAPL